jgi:hypothetical protein
MTTSAVLGLVAGLEAALLFGVGAGDPTVYAAVCAGLTLVALAAVWAPSWRATRIEPLAALRARR